MLPQKNGIDVCKNLREQNINVPIIMITAKSTLDDKIEGLNSGADDYLTKPFEVDELLVRIRALLRRPSVLESGVLTYKDLTLDLAKHTIMQGKIHLNFTLKEYSVLEYLMRNKGKTITREQILEHCWDLAFDSFSNIVDAYIKTIRGLGYQLQN
jgi:DNA-binding response OmpR family regulator